MNIKETLTILSEECAEVIQANSKLIRFGPYDEENVDELEKELGDVVAMMLVLDYYGYIKLDNVQSNVKPKLQKLKKYSKIKNLNKIIKNL
jgi:NTP pyrophosphatase (non-canonical NTP hydrolase)|tara:strand:- start:2845 stop:3117 length:273 start_codon:yes stop_codon:yes gene_type:complete